MAARRLSADEWPKPKRIAKGRPQSFMTQIRQKFSRACRTRHGGAKSVDLWFPFEPSVAIRPTACNALLLPHVGSSRARWRGDSTAAVSQRRSIKPTRASWFAATSKNRSILGSYQERRAGKLMSHRVEKQIAISKAGIVDRAWRTSG